MQQYTLALYNMGTQFKIFEAAMQAAAEVPHRTGRALVALIALLQQGAGSQECRGDLDRQRVAKICGHVTDGVKMEQIMNESSTYGANIPLLQAIISHFTDKRDPTSYSTEKTTLPHYCSILGHNADNTFRLASSQFTGQFPREIIELVEDNKDGKQVYRSIVAFNLNPPKVSWQFNTDCRVISKAVCTLIGVILCRGCEGNPTFVDKGMR